MSLMVFMRPRVPLALAVTLAVAASAPLAGQAPQGAHDAHRLHGDPAAYIAALEDPKRDAYQKPQEVLAALALKPGRSSPTSAQGPAISPFASHSTSVRLGTSMPSTSAPR